MERHGNVAAGTGRGSEAACADIGGPSDLPACCYGDGMEGLRCYYVILRGSPYSLCPVLRQKPLQVGPEPPLGASFCILPAYFCLPLAGQPAVLHDGPGPHWFSQIVGIRSGRRTDSTGAWTVWYWRRRSIRRAASG